VGFFTLAWRNVFGNSFRSVSIFSTAALIAGLALISTFLVRGAETSLRSNIDRMGADILVVPWGTITEKIEGVRLMSAAIDGWIPRSYMEQIAALEGVEAVSPQLYLGLLDDSPYNPYPDMFLVAYDPATDFTLQPWLESELDRLEEGEAIGGAYVSFPGGGSEIELHGVQVRLVERLIRTETSIDNSLFVSFETAEKMELWSMQHAKSSLKLMPGAVSAIMVKVNLDSDPHQVAVRMLEEIKGVTPLENPLMFQAERRQMIGVLQMLLGTLVGIWILALVFMALVFSIAVNERRFEMGVLRAIGFPSHTILKTLLIEGASLALLGGFAGIVLTMVIFLSLGQQFSAWIRLPVYTPSPLGLIFMLVGGQALSLLSVTIAAFWPAWRISREEAALSMRA
jgi:putative ABC transport system permease protein